MGINMWINIFSKIFLKSEIYSESFYFEYCFDNIILLENIFLQQNNILKFAIFFLKNI